MPDKQTLINELINDFKKNWVINSLLFITMMLIWFYLGYQSALNGG